MIDHLPVLLIALAGQASTQSKQSEGKISSHAFLRFISWEEGIVDYLVNEINESDED